MGKLRPLISKHVVVLRLALEWRHLMESGIVNEFINFYGIFFAFSGGLPFLFLSPEGGIGEECIDGRAGRLCRFPCGSLLGRQASICRTFRDSRQRRSPPPWRGFLVALGARDALAAPAALAPLVSLESVEQPTMPGPGLCEESY